MQLLIEFLIQYEHFIFPDDALHGLMEAAVCGMPTDVFCTNILVLYQFCANWNKKYVDL